jgi:DNA processing protein
MAIEQNRQVFAVPGSPLTGKTRGSNRLLKEGAKLVECVEDVIEEIAPQMGLAKPILNPDAATAPAIDKLDDKALESESIEVQCILNNLKIADKLHVDSIIEESGLNAQTVLKLLLELELRGLVTQHPGKLFSLA